MKKSFIFYVVALVTSLTAYVINIFSFLNALNNMNIEGNAYALPKNIYLTIMIVTIPLFVGSIVLMINSFKKTNELSIVPIILLVINLVIMFLLNSYISIHTFKSTYNTYAEILKNTSVTDPLYQMYKTIQTSAVYSLISGFTLPIVYLLSSVLALIFKVEENKTK